MAGEVVPSGRRTESNIHAHQRVWIMQNVRRMGNGVFPRIVCRLFAVVIRGRESDNEVSTGRASSAFRSAGVASTALVSCAPQLAEKVRFLPV